MLGSQDTAILPPPNGAPSPTGDIDPALTLGVAIRSLVLPSLDQRQLVVLVERRRRGQRPFARRCARPPWMLRPLLLAHKCMGYTEKEHEGAESRKVRSERGDQVPAGESIGIVGNAARHAAEGEEGVGGEH